MSEAIAKSEPTKRRVIFADVAAVKYNGVITSLSQTDIEATTITDAAEVLNRVAAEPFDIVVINLLLGGVGPFELIENIKKRSLNPNTKIIVVTRQVHKINIQNTIRAGADDFIAEPFENLNLFNRILYHLSRVKVIAPVGYQKSVPGEESWEYVRVLLEANELLSRTERGKIHESALKVLQDIAKLLDSNRTSLVIVDEPTNSGVVLATSDDPAFHNFPISLDKYPEILHVMHTGNLIFVEDVSQNSLTERIKKAVRSISIGSLMVFPVYFQGEIVGVLNIRRAVATELPSLNIMRILQAVANIMAAHSNTAVLLRRIYKDFPKAS